MSFQVILLSCAVLSRPVLSIIIFGIDDLTIFYLQQTQGIDLSIHLNELLTLWLTARLV